MSKITLVFSYNKEILTFIVENRNIYYVDRIFTKLFRCIPLDEDFRKKIIMSRNKIPKFIESFVNLPEKDKQEYEQAKDDNELAKIIKKDCREKGLILIKEEKT